MIQILTNTTNTYDTLRITLVPRQPLYDNSPTCSLVNVKPTVNDCEYKNRIHSFIPMYLGFIYIYTLL